MAAKLLAVKNFWKEYAPKQIKSSVLIFLICGVVGSVIMFVMTPAE